MDLVLNRREFRADGIFGELHDANGNFVAITLERAFLLPDGKISPKVAAGEYSCQRGTHRLISMTEDFITFEIENVPPFLDHDVTKILFHQGNYNENSEGCVLLGMGRGFKIDQKGWMITNSKDAFKNFMALQNECDSFKINIINPDL